MNPNLYSNYKYCYICNNMSEGILLPEGQIKLFCCNKIVDADLKRMAS